ncbi:hypothetical protein [Micromonospora sp. CB01531]|uniref:hypothetical protein n=1 Tax=Micromonospora sp. CB01531 TaxID=1718947 RepID=UPI00093AE1CC|nr:hypothetical protein [Micromonospora sp. CB01531]OKI52853.1 hypothetical protein A6A27_08150 [Micromonospora sp. CB01531]
MGKSKNRRGTPRPYNSRAIRADAARPAAGGPVLEEGAGWRPSPAAQARLSQLRQTTAAAAADESEPSYAGMDEVAMDEAGWQPSPAAQARLAQLRQPPDVDADGLTAADREWIDRQLALTGKGPNRAQRRAGQAEQIDVTVTWRGRPWRVHVDKNNLSVDLLEWFEEGKTTLALRELLGPQQWVQFKAMQPGHTGLNEMFELLAQELGFTSAGESSASPA